MDTLAERLRRRPAKPMGSPRVGSNPTGVAISWQITAVDAEEPASRKCFTGLPDTGCITKKVFLAESAESIPPSADMTAG